MAKKTIADIDVKGKKVLMRCDFNVPLDADCTITSDNRIVMALPSIKAILDGGGALILMSHLGRPKGEPSPEFSLRPVRDCLAGHLGRDVAFVEDCVGPAAEKAAAGLRPGDVLLLENLRFHAGEKKPDKEPDFSARLAALGDAYCNDAFGTAHRAHASMVAVAEAFERRAAGYLLAKEIDYFDRSASLATDLDGDGQLDFLTPFGGPPVQGLPLGSQPLEFRVYWGGNL